MRLGSSPTKFFLCYDIPKIGRLYSATAIPLYRAAQSFFEIDFDFVAQTGFCL